MARRVPYIPPSDIRSPRTRRPPPPKRPVKSDKKHRSDPKVRARAEELAAGGMPFQLAMAVALGRVTLNDAHERLARLEKVDRVIEEHELSRALATQVVIGHASLEAVLARRRLQEHREHNRTKSILEEALASGAPLAVALHGQRRLAGKVSAVDAYTVTIDDEESGAPQEIHKLQFKYAWRPDDTKRLRRLLRVDKELAANPREPIRQPQDRYTCSDKRLFRYLDREEPIAVTLLEGDQFRGTVTWFSRYEFGLQLRDVEIVIFRHCLHDITEG